MKNQFSIVYDEKKDVKDYANMLFTLVSNREEFKSTKVGYKVFNSQNCSPTTKDNTIYIGKDCAKNRFKNFKQTYANRGIYIGSCGSQAWIYCEKYDWSKQEFDNFYEEIKDLFKTAGLDESKIDKVDDGLEIDPEYSEKMNERLKKAGIFLPIACTMTQTILMPTMISSTLLMTLTPFQRLLNWFRRLWTEKNRLDMQYRFAVVYFYCKQLNEYMKYVQTDAE